MRNEKKVIIIIMLTGLLVFTGLLYFCIPSSEGIFENMAWGNRHISENTAYQISVESGYADETTADGFGEYPELYQFPFGKTDRYITNKEFSKSHPDDISKYRELPEGFYDVLLNTGYREIAENTDSYISSLSQYLCNGDSYYDMQDGTTCSPSEWIENMADYMVENEVSVEGHFISYDSLVYSDDYIYVRGGLLFRILSNRDENCPYRSNKWYLAVVDTPLMPDNEGFGPDHYKITDLAMIEPLCIREVQDVP